MSTTGHGHSEPGADPESIAVGHELKDANVGPLVFAALGLGVLLLVSFIVMGVVLRSTGNTLADTSSDLPTTTAMQMQIPPSPRLQQNAVIDGNQIIADATKKLAGYGWVDQQAGAAHIPIERAMELVVERGVAGK
ncbi:MAG: hypothetical protein WCJ55_00950 [Chloroflexales bacterium]